MRLLICLATLLPAGTLAAAEIRGVVEDLQGHPIAGAIVTLRSSYGSLASPVLRSSDGSFTFSGLAPGAYSLRVEAKGMGAVETPARTGASRLQVVLRPMETYTRVSVTAMRGEAGDLETAPQIVLSRSVKEQAGRPIATIGNVFDASPGILVQQSSYAQVSPFLRGLTGYQVLNLIDGVRFNNATFRSGPNQYLVFVEPSQARRVEAMLGPSGSQYGSDALGGAINIITPETRFAPSGSKLLHGEWLASGASADASLTTRGELSWGSERLAALVGACARRHNDLRAGGGLDSRNVFHRYFGMPLEAVRELSGSRLQDTGFHQQGVHTKFGARLAESQQLTFWYQHGRLGGSRGYKDLLGGLGRLRSDFDPQSMHFFYSRYEKLGLGALDSLTGTFSVNSQSDGSVRQGLRATDPITSDQGRVNAYGYSGQATTHIVDRTALVFGGDIYDERIQSRRLTRNPVSGREIQERPLNPDGSTYRTYGLFAQSTTELVRNRLRAGLGGRYSEIRFRAPAAARFGTPAVRESFRDFTFNGSLTWEANRWLGVHAMAGEGFRAPNLNDLGTIGLNDLGYEIPASEAIGAGALMGNSAGEGALSLGKPVAPLSPERLRNLELGVRLHSRRHYARVQVFDTELTDPVVRRTLLFPTTAVPSQLAGLAVTPLAPTAAQRAQGVVTVATALDARAVKAFVNDGASRYWGVEALWRWSLHSSWSLESHYSFLVGRDLYPNRNIRRLPPQAGAATLRYTPSSRRFWFAASLVASGAQSRLSGGDRDDERIGAARSRADIASFFQGARVQAMVDAASGVFLPTGESLRQIQDRVLPLNSVVNGVRISGETVRAPVYTRTAGWAVAHVRGGVPLGERSSLLFALENLLDRNYRLHGSGIDSPGFNAYLAFRYSF